jgi:hypothetical protein
MEHLILVYDDDADDDHDHNYHDPSNYEVQLVGHRSYEIESSSMFFRVTVFFFQNDLAELNFLTC